jgi:hypothetical protein
MVDIDGWHVCDLITPLFFNDNMELHNLIHKRLILPYLTDSFHPSLIEEYTVGLLMDLQKQDGGIRPILCGQVHLVKGKTRGQQEDPLEMLIFTLTTLHLTFVLKVPGGPGDQS